MSTINSDSSILLVVDFQTRLMPQIADNTAVVANARRLLDAARMLKIPVVFTEQNADGLGPTVPELRSETGESLIHKMTFDACRVPAFEQALAGRSNIVVAGCEAHVCVLQTVLGLRGAGRHTYVVRDALGSRRAESKETAIQRMSRHGAEIATTEMVLFEWLATAEHPQFRQVLSLVK